MKYVRKDPPVTLWLDWWTLLKELNHEQLGRLIAESFNSSLSGDRKDNFDNDETLRVLGNFVIEQIQTYRAKKQADYDKNQENRTADVFPRFP